MRYLFLLSTSACFITPQPYEDRRELLSSTGYADCDDDGLADEANPGIVGGDPPECGGAWLFGDELRWDCDDEDPDSDERLGALCAEQLGDAVIRFGATIAVFTPESISRASAAERCRAWGGMLAALDSNELLVWAEAEGPSGWTDGTHDGTEWVWADGTPVDPSLLCADPAPAAAGLVSDGTCLATSDTQGDQQQYADGFYCQHESGSDLR